MAKIYTDEKAVEKAGGRFKLASLLEKRYKELVFGARPLVERTSKDPMDLLLAEVVEGKIELVPEAEAVAAAAAALLGDSDKGPKADKEEAEEESAEETGDEG